MKAQHLMAFFGVIVLPAALDCSAGGTFPSSSDGQYEAVEISDEKGLHYQIKEVKSGQTLFVTRAAYETPNDVKAGIFSPDNKRFGAAYHYGHEGPTTWVGIWEVPSGKWIEEKEKSGYLTDLTWVFPD